MRGDYEDDKDQYFVFSDGSPVTPNHVRKLVKSTLKSLNLDEKLYGTHSFRIGRATDLQKLGHSIDVIKQCGGGNRMQCSNI